MKRALVCLIAMGCLGLGRPGRAGQRPIVAVFPIQDVAGKLERGLLDSLTEYLSAAVAAGGSFSIQAPGEVRRLLTEKTRESYRECYDEQCQIELGRELAANKMISAKIIQLGSACTVTAALYDLRTQATDITATADGGCRPAQLKASLDEVAAKLRAWGSQRRPAADDFHEGQIGERVKPLADPGGEETIVAFRSQPPGAVVIVDGVLVCEQTPCSRKFPVGAHQVSMQKKRYRGRSEQVVFARGVALDWELEPTFGMLTVHSQPTGMQVLANGEPIGRTPLERHPLDPGNYEVLVADPCYYDQGERVKIQARRVRTVEVSLAPKVGGLQIDTRDQSGNDVAAELAVDGRPLGRAPGRFQVSVCAHKLSASLPGRGATEVDLEVTEGEWRKLDLTLQPESPGVTGSPNGQAAQADQDQGLTLDFHLAPSFGYAGLLQLRAKGFGTDGSDGSELTADVKGPSAGVRADLFFSKLFGLVARYDYLFLNQSGLGSLSAAFNYSGLWGTIQGDSLELLPSATMYLGLGVIHAADDQFGQKLTDRYLKLAMLLSLDLSLDLVVGEMFYVGLAGEFGYLFTSFGDSSSSSGSYTFNVTVRAGLHF